MISLSVRLVVRGNTRAVRVCLLGCSGACQGGVACLHSSAEHAIRKRREQEVLLQSRREASNAKMREQHAEHARVRAQHEQAVMEAMDQVNGS